MPKFTLALNSHALSHFQECEAKFLYNDIIGLEPISRSKAMERGTEVAKWLQLYYYAKIRARRQKCESKKFEAALLNPFLWPARFDRRLNFSREDAYGLYSALMAYRSNYTSDWEPIAVEKGFSKILYEDDENLFVYEGRPDLIAKTRQGELVIVDHKTQGQTYSLYPFNNQAIGYIWAFEANQFVYNYINFKTKIPTFRREPFTFTDEQINVWKANTLKWFWRVKSAMGRVEYLPSLHCEGKYSTCQFVRICEQPRQEIQAWIAQSQFRKRGVYRSW